MNNPITHAKYVLASLPPDPTELTAEHLPTIAAAVAARARFDEETRKRQEKLASAIYGGDRSPAVAKRLGKVEKQLARLVQAEALLEPYVDQALEIEAEGELQ